MVSYSQTSDEFTEIHFCFQNHFRPSVRRRLESPENTVPVMVRRSVRWWRRSKSPSTESTPARSAARMPWSARVSESGLASAASESSPEVPGSTQQQQLPQSDQPFVVSVIWLKNSVFNTRKMWSTIHHELANKSNAQSGSLLRSFWCFSERLSFSGSLICSSLFKSSSTVKNSLRIVQRLHTSCCAVWWDDRQRDLWNSTKIN